MPPDKVTHPRAENSIGGEVATWRTIPNLLPGLRVLLILPFAYFAMNGEDLKALAVFALAGVTDALDGSVARWLNQTSMLGRLIDPVADKLLMGISYVVLSLLRRGNSAIPIWVMAVVIGRDVFILVGCWIVYRMVHDTGFKPTLAGKVNTLIEIGVIVWFLAGSRFPVLSAGLTPLYVVMTLSIVVSANDYARQGVKMVRAASGK